MLISYRPPGYIWLTAVWALL